MFNQEWAPSPQAQCSTVTATPTQGKSELDSSSGEPPEPLPPPALSSQVYCGPHPTLLQPCPFSPTDSTLRPSPLHCTFKTVRVVSIPLARLLALPELAGGLWPELAGVQGPNAWPHCQQAMPVSPTFFCRLCLPKAPLTQD